MDILIGNSKISLDQHNYVGQGGQATIYQKGGKAYKIYHDPSKLPPIAKLKELGALKDITNILAPHDIVFNTKNQAVGIMMPYIPKTEYLCKLFTRGFRDSNGVNPAMIAAIVKRAQDSLKEIHKRKFLVVDYNPFNFLTNPAFDEYYHIDVDSWQTPNYKADAIMASITDPLVKNNHFTELSDWYSWGIVMFELYVGSHPHKGRHPDYGKDWQEMQKNHVSLFNKATRLPPNVQDWSVIPKGHLKWFERVFEHGERIAPPEPDQVNATAGQVVPQIVSSNAKFDLKLIRTYDGDVEAIRWITGVEYARASKGLYIGGRLFKALAPMSGFSARYATHDFAYVQNDQPVTLEFDRIKEEITWEKLDGKQSGVIAASSYFVANDRLYTVNENNLVEHSFMNLGAKVIAPQQIVGNVFHTHKTFDGVIVQDILGAAHLSIPVKPGQVNLIKAACLNRTRVIDAKYAKGIAIVLAEQEGKICRWTFVFDKSLSSFTTRREDNVTIQDIKLAVLDKGVAVASNDDKLEIFVDIVKIKVVDDSPLTGNQKLASFGNEIMVVNKNELFKLSMK